MNKRTTRERRAQLRQLRATAFAAEPQAEGIGPQKYADVVRDLLQQHYNRLLRHARRDIGHDELADDLPEGAMDARDIVNEAARRAEAKVAEKPKGMDWLVWFYQLLEQEVAA